MSSEEVIEIALAFAKKAAPHIAALVTEFGTAGAIIKLKELTEQRRKARDERVKKKFKPKKAKAAAKKPAKPVKKKPAKKKPAPLPTPTFDDFDPSESSPAVAEPDLGEQEDPLDEFEPT